MLLTFHFHFLLLALLSGAYVSSCSATYYAWEVPIDDQDPDDLLTTEERINAYNMNEEEAIIEKRRLKRRFERLIFLSPVDAAEVEWVNEVALDVPFIAYTRMNYGHIRNIEPNLGKEAAAYLRFILDNYDHYLPDYTAFLQGHRAAWHSSPIDKVLEGLYWGRAPFMNLNWCTINDLAHNSCLALYPVIFRVKASPQNWAELFSRYFGPKPPHVAFYCCAQFVVSKERIRARPKAAYQEWYDFLMSEKMDSFGAACIFESMWPIIFGESYDMQPHPGGMATAQTNRFPKRTRVNKRYLSS